MDVIRTIRTSPHTARRVQTHEDHDANVVRLVAKILRELLQQERFDDLSDLAEALKCRCARMKIRGYGRLVPRALGLVASNRPLVSSVPSAARVALHADARPLSRAKAAALVVRLGVGGAMKTLPRTTTGRRIDIDGPVRDVIDIESLVGGVC